MDSYLVRIYRREENTPRLLEGTVEEPGGNGKETLSNLHELWEILNRKKEMKKRKTAGNGRRKKE